jgi:hypothetical protein
MGHFCAEILDAKAMFFVTLTQSEIQDLIDSGPPNNTQFHRTFGPFFKHSGLDGFKIIKERLKQARLERLKKESSKNP